MATPVFVETAAKQTAESLAEHAEFAKKKNLIFTTKARRPRRKGESRIRRRLKGYGVTRARKNKSTKAT